MAKNLRSRLDESEFQRFKRIKAELGAGTNDEALSELMDLYEKDNKSDGDVEDE
jgi:hypothetical protein